MKKFALVIIAIIVAFSSVYPPEVAHANLISKPISIAAKKAAKIPIKNTAVEMANQIVSDYLVRELIEGVKTDDGYSPVCMDGKKDSIKDCAPDKRAQIKTKLSSADKSKLEKTVESVLERKTNTSSKWGKFLDIFVPLFLVSGAIEIISASLDGDILSFFDEIAQDALLETGLLKPLSFKVEIGELTDFSKVMSAYDFKLSKLGLDYNYITINTLNKPNVSYELTAGDRDFNVNNSMSYRFTIMTAPQWFVDSNPKRYYYELYMFGHIGDYTSPSKTVYQSSPIFSSLEDAKVDANNYIETNILSSFSNASKDVNELMNLYVGYFSQMTNIDFKIPKYTPQPPEIKTDYGKQTATDKIKDSNGNVPLKGINSFTFTYGDTHIYPSDQSTTGWKDKTTGEDITVVEDDVVVDDGSGPTDPTDPGGIDDPPDKDKTKEQLEDESKKLGNLVTTRFPFSLPWDFVAMVKLLYAEPMTPKWEVKGTEEIPLNFTINLNFLDPYISWFRGFIMVGFVISVIFMHGRFMGGSK